MFMLHYSEAHITLVVDGSFADWIRLLAHVIVKPLHATAASILHWIIPRCHNALIDFIDENSMRIEKATGKKQA